MFGFLEVGLTIRNEYPAKVRVNWIHGSFVKEMVVLEPKEVVERIVYLSHTLHAERISCTPSRPSTVPSAVAAMATRRGESSCDDAGKPGG